MKIFVVWKIRQTFKFILLQIGSPTALADSAAYEKTFKAAKASSYGLYVPAGAFWGGQDIQKMADRGTLKVYTLDPSMMTPLKCWHLPYKSGHYAWY